MCFARAAAQAPVFIASCVPAAQPPCFPQRCRLSQNHSRKFGDGLLRQPDLFCSVYANLDLLSDTADSSPPPTPLTLQLTKLSEEINTHSSWKGTRMTTSFSTILKRWLQHLRGTRIVPGNSQTPKPEGTLTSENTAHAVVRASLSRVHPYFFSSHLHESLPNS